MERVDAQREFYDLSRVESTHCEFTTGVIYQGKE